MNDTRYFIAVFRANIHGENESFRFFYEYGEIELY